VILGRSRFRDLVDRQLTLFVADQRELLDEAAEAELAWTNAPRDEAEERYGDYQLVVDAIADALADVRDQYASSLDDAAAEAYRTTFDRATKKRFGRLAGTLGDA
jgi:hypothetical protein